MLHVARVKLREVGVKVAGLRIRVCPGIRGHRRSSRLRSTAVELQPVTISQVVGLLHVPSGDPASAELVQRDIRRQKLRDRD